MGANLEILYGNMEVQITLPKLTTEIKIKKILWFTWSTKVYYVDYEFCRVGPYKDYDEANEMLIYALRAYK